MNKNAESKSQLWYPEPDPHFGPWIEYSGGGMPVDPDCVVQYLTALEREERNFWDIPTPAEYVMWQWEPVAYRIMLKRP